MQTQGFTLGSIGIALPGLRNIASEGCYAMRLNGYVFCHRLDRKRDPARGLIPSIPSIFFPNRLLV